MHTKTSTFLQICSGLFQGKCNGKVGYFPATYLIPIQTGQRVFQVIHSMHLTEGGNGMKLHKDQVTKHLSLVIDYLPCPLLKY